MPDVNPTTAEHLEIARKRGRGLLAAEAADGWSHEVLQATGAGRDGAILILALWAILAGLGQAGETAGPLLLTAAVAFALYSGIANALAVGTQLRHWAGELERERREIRESPEQEREELRAIYAAKGFTGRQLESIVDTLAADDDRLLRVMMEEELGIFFEQINHPVATGLLTGLASVAGGLSVALAAISAIEWLPIAAAALVLVLAAWIRTGRPVPAVVESIARWGLTAGAVAGVAFFLSRLIATAY